MSKLISFVVPSRRLNEAKGFLDSIEQTTANPSVVEVLFKFDLDQEGIKDFIEAEIQKRPFDIKYIITPRLEGNYSLWLACNKLFFISSPESYFVQALSDEVRIRTYGWDNILLGYVGFFPDHVFRLRTSTQKLCNYYTQFECNYIPDSFPIYTRQWLTLTEGFGDCWGSDAYQQAVAFHMGLGIDGYKSVDRSGALYRDVVIQNEIKYEGIAEYGIDLSEEQIKLRTKWIYYEWDRLVSHCKQEEFSYYAKKIYLYVLAHRQNIKHFKLIKDEKCKKVFLIDLNHHKIVSEVSYAVPLMHVFYTNMRRKYLQLIRKLNKKKGYIQIFMCYCFEVLLYLFKLIFSSILYLGAQSFLIFNLLVRLFLTSLKAIQLIYKVIEKVFCTVILLIKNVVKVIFSSTRFLGRKVKLNKVDSFKNFSRRFLAIEQKSSSDKPLIFISSLKAFFYKNIVEKAIILNNSIDYQRKLIVIKAKKMLQVNFKNNVIKRQQKINAKCQAKAFESFTKFKRPLRKILFENISNYFTKLPPSAARIQFLYRQRPFFKLSRAMRLGEICKVTKEDVIWAIDAIEEEQLNKANIYHQVFNLKDQVCYQKQQYPDLGYW